MFSAFRRDVVFGIERDTCTYILQSIYDCMHDCSDREFASWWPVVGAVYMVSGLSWHRGARLVALVMGRPDMTFVVDWA